MESVAPGSTQGSKGTGGERKGSYLFDGYVDYRLSDLGSILNRLLFPGRIFKKWAEAYKAKITLKAVTSVINSLTFFALPPISLPIFDISRRARYLRLPVSTPTRTPLPARTTLLTRPLGARIAFPSDDRARSRSPSPSKGLVHGRTGRTSLLGKAASVTPPSREAESSSAAAFGAGAREKLRQELLNARRNLRNP